MNDPAGARAAEAEALYPGLIKRLVADALTEDLGLAGDITSRAIVAEGAQARAAIVARRAGVIAGLDLAEETFRQLSVGRQLGSDRQIESVRQLGSRAPLDCQVVFERRVGDGDEVAAGATVATVAGAARLILAGERVALNFLTHMSGIATLTRRYVEAVSGTRARICSTRKTLPGLRAIEKYAVRAGGGMNHRFGLFDAILIKDNHIAIAGDVSQAIQRARAHAGHMVKIEVEVDDLPTLRAALDAGVDAVLLDNMDLATLERAVALVAGRALTEASGGMTLENVAAVAATGVDMISVGALTHSVPALDLGLDFMG